MGEAGFKHMYFRGKRILHKSIKHDLCYYGVGDCDAVLHLGTSEYDDERGEGNSVIRVGILDPENGKTTFLYVPGATTSLCDNLNTSIETIKRRINNQLKKQLEQSPWTQVDQSWRIYHRGALVRDEDKKRWASGSSEFCTLYLVPPSAPSDTRRRLVASPNPTISATREISPAGSA